jgi:Domain of unknown function (DUF4129)
VRGRAGSAALPVLIVLLLVGIVAVASTGSTPNGSGKTRPPSDTLLDTLFTLGLAGVVVGGVLVIWGLTQRKAIANEIASGRYRRTTLLGWICFTMLFGAFTYWRLRGWTPPLSNADEGDPVFRGESPLPRTPKPGDPEPYEPGISWLAIAVVVGLVVAAAVAYVLAGRRARPADEASAALAAELADVLDDTLDDLRTEADPRRAIIAAYARLERVLAANGVPRLRSETPDEYLARVLHDLELTPDAIGRLTALFTQAKFSHHAVDDTMKESAIAALEQVRDELRSIRDAPPTTDQHAPEVVTS